MSVIGITGHPQAVEAYLRGPDGAATARALAHEVMADEDALADFEIGQLVLPGPIADALDVLIAERDR